ncbi:hypothetical protein PAMP_010988 [Pampus punctatissimus]
MAHLKVLDCMINNNWSLICDLYCAWNNQSQHSTGRISPKAPTAFNQLGHEALQMGLSVGWDCRGRAVGGGGGGGGGGGLSL